jgi:hypothetical protein
LIVHLKTIVWAKYFICAFLWVFLLSFFSFLRFFKVLVSFFLQTVVWVLLVSLFFFPFLFVIVAVLPKSIFIFLDCGHDSWIYHMKHLCISRLVNRLSISPYFMSDVYYLSYLIIRPALIFFFLQIFYH